MHLNTSVIGAFLPCILVLTMLVSGASAQDEIENILFNGDFEEGTMDWSFGAGFNIDEEEEPVGGFGQVVYTDVFVVGPDAWVPEIHSPSFSMEQGKTYTFSFWAKAEPGTGGRTLDPSFEQLDTWVGLGTNITLTEEWQEYHFTGVWPHPSSPPNVVIHIGWALQLGNVWFSHFRVYEGDWEEEDLEIPGQQKIAVTPLGRLATAWGQVKSR